MIQPGQRVRLDGMRGKSLKAMAVMVTTESMGRDIKMNIFKYGFLQNQWLWFHILGAAVLLRIVQIWYTDQQSFLAVLVIAVLWEVFEYFTSDIEKIYGSKKLFFLDSLGDIFSAVLIMLIMVL